MAEIYGIETFFTINLVSRHKIFIDWESVIESSRSPLLKNFDWNSQPSGFKLEILIVDMNE